MKPELTLHERTLQLQRYPVRQNDPLQAWDAADEYIINYVQELDISLDPQRPILIFNDNFGALSCWFANDGKVTTVTDSFIAKQGIIANLTDNHLPPINIIDALTDLPEQPQLVLMKLPKNNRLLVWQLQQLCQLLPADCTVIAADKAKAIHSSTLKLFEKHLGETKTSLAVKKARLVFCQPNNALSKPLPAPQQWDVPEHDMTIANYPNVFSSDNLDIGARLLLDNIPSDSKYRDIIDLGCGNGVIGMKAARLNPHANVTCVDESYMAVASCQLNAKQNLSTTDQFNAKVNNCLDDFPADSADLVLCNPPFHQQNAITGHIAWQMFCDAKRVLRPKGQLIIIGNRHLGYDDNLKRLFGNVTTIAKNNKFVVYLANK
ncbi:methyltransferase [Photobacterium minamisatsumaniensis]|uniref:methyltransferase n=1 Tax=Photobacterium minamisatsumaniensis TaxID=2910233 RepID=UPI003D0DF17C